MPMAKPKGSEAGGKHGVAGANVQPITVKVPPTPSKIYGGGK